MARIVMTLIGDIRYDGRVRKEILTLKAAGHSVDLIVSDFSGGRCGGGDLGAPIHFLPTRLWGTPIANFAEQLRFNVAAAQLLEQLRPAYIHSHDLTTLLAGVRAKKRTGAQLVFDAHELLPEMWGGIRRLVWNQIERRCVGSCDLFILAEQNRAEYFHTKYPCAGPITVIGNYPRCADLPASRYDYFREQFPIGREQIIVLYTGVLGPGRQVEELIESMTLCEPRYVLVLLGRAFKGYLRNLQDSAVTRIVKDRVFFHEPALHSQILQYMSSADIGVAFYANTNLNNYYCASNKVYEYIALEKPIVTNDYPGLIDVVQKPRQGICLSEVAPQTLARAFPRAMTGDLTLGRRKFFWEENEEELRKLYEQTPSGTCIPLKRPRRCGEIGDR